MKPKTHSEKLNDVLKRYQKKIKLFRYDPMRNKRKAKKRQEVKLPKWTKDFEVEIR